MPKLTIKAIRYGATDERIDPNYRKASLLKIATIQQVLKDEFILSSNIYQVICSRYNGKIH